MTQSTFDGNGTHGDARAIWNANGVDAESRLSSLEGSQGFEDGNDTTGDVVLVADTWTAVPNDGAGAFSNDAYLPAGISTLFDFTVGKFDPTELKLGDVLLVRNDFTITPSVNGAYLEYRYTLGTGGGAYTLPTQLGTLSNGAGVPYRFASRVDKIYMGDANTRDNLIGLEVRCSEPATLNNAGSAATALKGPTA